MLFIVTFRVPSNLANTQVYIPSLNTLMSEMFINVRDVLEKKLLRLGEDPYQQEWFGYDG